MSIEHTFIYNDPVPDSTPAPASRSGGTSHVRWATIKAVEAVLETWRIDDEWWRERPVSRMYYSLLLEDGRTVTVCRELVSGRSAHQTY